MKKQRYTTDINALRHGAQFTWGKVVEIVDVAEYTIVKYQEWQSDGSSILTGTPDETNVAYHGYLNGNDVSRSWNTLDAALAGLIAYKYDGSNSQAGDFFMKMIGAVEKK